MNEVMEFVGFPFTFFVFSLFGLLGLLGTALWIWMLIDCGMNEPPEGNEKIVWILVIVFTHWIGALIYLLARRPQRIREVGK